MAAGAAVGDDGRHNVLLVDDRPENLLALEASLEELGQNLVKAGSGKDALREILKRDFALILLDVTMPGMDGFETAALIRQRPSSQYTPIIFVTAGTGVENHLSRGYELGAVDYLFTPLVPQVLRAKVRAFIDLARKAEVIRRKEEWLRTAAERRAELLESRLQSLLELLEVGFFRCTLDGKLIDANPAFERQTGLSSREPRMLARLRQVADGEPRDLELWRLCAAHPGSQASPQEPIDVELQLPDGRAAWVSLRLARTLHPGGEPCIEGLLTDIEARKRAEEELWRTNAALQRANEDMNHFVYAASHDLQEPLRMVTSYTQLLQRRYQGRLDEQADEFIRHATEGAGRMRSFLHDLLDYLQATGETDPPPEPVDCAEVLTQVLLNLEDSIRQAGAVVTHGELPTVRAQRVHVLQVLQNLISNSIKYRRDEPPAIHVHAARERDLWRISVADNGLGFEKEYAQQVFGLFKRLHGQRYPGTGIGLALCTKLVERHGGRIWAESVPGQGSTFHFLLPAWGASAAEVAPPAGRTRLTTPARS
ncbi:MAG TPA: ATP-binding protein [Planctomycetota bacterium]|nr:ATP-binding protein [Planctomycetota bacterium]